MAVKTTGLSCLLIAVLVSAAEAQEAAPVRPRALLVNFNPILESRSGQRLHQVGGWNDPSPLTGGYISDLNQASHGLMNYRLTRTVNMDAWPIKQDGFRYTDESYLQCLSTWSGWHSPDLCDYKSKCRDLDLARKVDSGEIDEVLDHSAPYFGGYETRMIGRGGYWCNSPALRRVACSKIFIISVFNYERGVGEMLEDYGHRAESILRYVYGSWEAQKTHAWNRFTLYDKIYPGEAACGNVHFAPNSQSDYDWGNSTLVWSSCDDWLANFPNLQGTKRLVNRADWGNGDIRQHHVWWFTHMPHVSGTLTEYGMTRLNNWWAYMQDFNRYPESNGDHAPGGTAPAAQAYPVPPRRITSNSTDDWAPQINQAGRMVWHAAGNGGFDIFSGNLDGTGIVRITNDAMNDEDPRINAAGRIVWQRFDGTDYEIFSANADGSNIVQITNNSTNDWHPVINDAGRIAWDRFDGVDYEIFSANADGSNVVQVTNNQAAAGFPREDVWPQINNAGRIVWFGYSGSNWEIYSADSNGANLVNVSNSVYEDEYPQISDSGRVVWHRWLSDSNAEIMSAPATGGSVVALSSNSYEDWYPQINSSDQVVWMSRSPNDWEIMTCPAAGGNRRGRDEQLHARPVPADQRRRADRLAGIRRARLGDLHPPQRRDRAGDEQQLGRPLGRHERPGADVLARGPGAGRRREHQRDLLGVAAQLCPRRLRPGWRCGPGGLRRVPTLLLGHRPRLRVRGHELQRRRSRGPDGLRLVRGVLRGPRRGRRSHVCRVIRRPPPDVCG